MISTTEPLSKFRIVDVANFVQVTNNSCCKYFQHYLEEKFEVIIIPFFLFIFHNFPINYSFVLSKFFPSFSSFFSPFHFRSSFYFPEEFFPYPFFLCPPGGLVSFLSAPDNILHFLNFFIPIPLLSSLMILLLDLMGHQRIY